jgi:hypothetical protein
VNTAPTFVPAETFGQLSEATHGTIANSSNTPTTLNISEQVSWLLRNQGLLVKQQVLLTCRAWHGIS